MSRTEDSFDSAFREADDFALDLFGCVLQNPALLDELDDPTPDLLTSAEREFWRICKQLKADGLIPSFVLLEARGVSIDLIAKLADRPGALLPNVKFYRKELHRVAQARRFAKLDEKLKSAKGDEQQSILRQMTAISAETESTDFGDHLSGPDGLHLTSVGNSDRFLRDFRGDLLWTEGPTLNSAGTFYYWDGQRWLPDNTQAVLLGKQTVGNLKQLVSLGVEAGHPSDLIKAYINFWRSCENDSKIDEILSLAKWELAVKRGKFDSDPDVLGVRNGVVELTSGRFREARREDYITKQANVIFDELATCPMWEVFLLDVAQADHALIAYLQQCAGMCLSGHVWDHLFFVVSGPGGTGKSTFCETLKFVWGDYCCGIDPNSLAASQRPEGGKARPDLARLPGVRLVFANESRKGLLLDSGLVKALTGGDTMQARALYQAEFDFVPTHKLWLRTNEPPTFDGADTGMQRRVKKVPFDFVVKQAKAEDRNLPEKLRAEAAGILNWAIRGLLSYQQHGLVEPPIIATETAEYIRSLDVLAQFMEDECEVGPFSQPSGSLYERYRNWSEGRGQRPTSSPRFKRELEAKGFRLDRHRDGNSWFGFQLCGGCGSENQNSL